MEKKFDLRRFMMTGYVLFAVIVIAVFYMENRIHREAEAWVTHSYAVRERIQMVFTKLREVGSLQRSYMLTGDTTYLQEYQESLRPEASRREGQETYASLPLVRAEIANLRKEVSDNPAQLRNIDTMALLAESRQVYADTLVSLRRDQGLTIAAAHVALGYGRWLTQETRSLESAMLREEGDKLNARREWADQKLHENKVLLYSIVAVFYLAWLLALWSASRQRKRRMAAEKELRASATLLDAVIEGSRYAIMASDANDKVTVINRAAERMLGYKAKELLGQSAAKVMGLIFMPEEVEARAARVAAQYGRAPEGVEVFTLPLKDDASYGQELTFVRRDGTRFPAVMSVSLMRDDDGEELGAVAVANDMTEMKALESDLQKSNNLLNAVIHGTDYAVFVADPRGIVQIFSRGAERMLGHEARDFVGRPVTEVTAGVFLPEELEARARRIWEQYGRPPEGIEIFNLPLKDDGPMGQEWTNVRADGTRLTVAVSVWELKGDDGAPQGSVAIARDITAIKALERMKSEFISTVSHELRTPLTSIRGALGLVAGGAAGPLPEKVTELVSIAHRNSERLVHIINDILDIEKIESGKLSMHLRPLEAREFLRQALEVNKAYGDKYGVRFTLTDAPPEASIQADPDRLMQVMANLLSNAAKFSPAGSEVLVSAEERGDRIRFSIRDFGAGIPPEFHSRIFEKFAQAENTDARRYEGTGLGLSITKKLVEAMRGSIGFETALGNGTEFFFEIPAAKAEEPVSEASAFPKTRERILICEDDRDVATLLKILLERVGFDVDVANTLAEARGKLETCHYAALTLDLVLPDGNGLGLLRTLRADPRWADLPIVVVSATAEEGRRELNGDAIGMIDWMMKPIDEGQLIRSLRRVVSGSTDKPRILHVEDDADLRHILARSLQGSVEWVGASTLQEAERRLGKEPFDLVVLDLDLPDGSGLELLERLNGLTGHPIPVLILSASETSETVRRRVEASLVKSRMSEERIVETILTLIRKHNQAPPNRTES